MTADSSGPNTFSPDVPLGSLVLAAARRVEAKADTAMSDPEHRPPVTGILYLIGRNPGMSQRALAERLSMDTTTLGRHVDRLEKDGLIERRVSAADRRARELYLLDKGRPVFDRIDETVRTLDGATAARLGEEAYGELAALLKRFLAVTEDL